METRAFLSRARPDSGRARAVFASRRLVLLVALVTGCSAERARTDAAITHTDDLGVVVSLPAPARRIVSLSPDHTELLFAIGAGDRVVGRTKWDSWPPEALHVPSVGDGLNPNVEAIAARRPDLVVLYASPTNAMAVQQLADLGIPVFNLKSDRLDDVARGARVFGRLTGLEARADSLATAFAAALDSARGAVPAGPRQRVLLLAWEQPPIVIGGGSFQSEIVRLAGAENVFGDLAQPSAQVTIETIVTRDPDVIVRLGAIGVPAWAGRPEWRAVRAVRERRFVSVEGSEFEHPSFRAFDGVRRLRAALRASVE